MTVKIYGIPNCDTMKKAFEFMKTNNVAYDFHDYKTSGIEAAKLKSWAKSIGWEKVLNKGSTTFRDLPHEAKAGLDEGQAIKLMVAQPSMIKRPIWEVGGDVYAGFKPNSPERRVLEAAITEL